MEEKRVIAWIKFICQSYKEEYCWNADDNLYLEETFKKLRLLKDLKSKLEED